MSEGPITMEEMKRQLSAEVAALQARRLRSTELDSWIERSGRCIDCGDEIEITIHMMRDVDGTEWRDRQRSRCSCRFAGDYPE